MDIKSEPLSPAASSISPTSTVDINTRTTNRANLENQSASSSPGAPSSPKSDTPSPFLKTKPQSTVTSPNEDSFSFSEKSETPSPFLKTKPATTKSPSSSDDSSRPPSPFL